MALTEQVQLDIQNAQRQIDTLERQLEGLSTPVNVPVSVTGEQKLAEIRRELGLADNSVDSLNRELDETDDSLRNIGRSADRAGSDIETAGRRGSGAFRGLSASVIGLIGAFGAIQGARAFLGFASDAISAASDLEESTSKAQVVFGEFFDDIQAFSSTAPQALGLANAAALEFTGTFGNLFTALGLSQQAAAELAPQIVQLGADLASFNNIEVTDALDKLRAGLVGEAEPLRALGVNLTAATVNAKALELGLAASTTEVSEAAKVQARYALILEQTSTAQGDFARTADGIANRQRTLAGEFENVRAVVGQALLPAFENILDIAPALIGIIEQGLVPAIASLGTALGEVDTQGFTRALAGLPSAVGSVFTEIGAGTQALGNALQVFGAIARLDFGDVGVQFQQLSDDIARFREAPVANQAVQNLITTLDGGREPVAALEAVLAELGDSVSSLTLDTFEQLAERLLAISLAAGATPQDLDALADSIEAFGEDAGFSAAGVEILAAALRGPLQQALEKTSAGDAAIRRFAESFGQIPPAVRGASPAIAEFQAVMEGLTFEDEITRIEAEFDRLPDGLDAAAAALRDEENEIVTDFTDFLDDLDDQIAARQAFRSNLELLEAFGLDQLAEVFREEGLDAAAALADAVANPEEARRAEALLDAEAEAIAQSFRETLAAAIIGESLDLTVPVNITAAIQSLILAGIPGLQAAGIVGASGAGPNVGAGVTVNQTFTDPTTPTTEAARAAQSVNSLVNVR